MREKTLSLVYIALLTLGLSSSFAANAADEQCQQYTHYQRQGLQAYKSQDYTQARRNFEYQVILAEICPAHHHQKSLAYNNIALTYFHQQRYLTADVWLKLAPDSNQSKANAHFYAKEIEQAKTRAQASINGQYWSYVGQDAWNRISVKKTANNLVDISFSGMYPGRNILKYGPHMGDLTARITVKNHQGVYQTPNGECKIHFHFLPNKLIVKQSRAWCSFGAGVSATGHYQKVDDRSDD